MLFRSPPPPPPPYTRVKGGKKAGDLAGSKFARGKSSCTFAKTEVRCVNARGLNFTGRYTLSGTKVTMHLDHHNEQLFELKGKDKDQQLAPALP